MPSHPFVVGTTVHVIPTVAHQAAQTGGLTILSLGSVDLDSRKTVCGDLCFLSLCSEIQREVLPRERRD